MRLHLAASLYNRKAAGRPIVLQNVQRPRAKVKARFARNYGPCIAVGFTYLKLKFAALEVLVEGFEAENWISHEFNIPRF